MVLSVCTLLVVFDSSIPQRGSHLLRSWYPLSTFQLVGLIVWVGRSKVCLHLKYGSRLACITYSLANVRYLRNNDDTAPEIVL